MMFAIVSTLPRLLLASSVLLTGCSTFEGWSPTLLNTEGETSVRDRHPPYVPEPTDLSQAEGIRAAVADAQDFLHQQDEKIRDLFEMRAELEEQIRTIQDGQLTELHGETEALRVRMGFVEGRVRETRQEVDDQWAPIQAMVEAQAGEMAQVKEAMVAVVEETHQDRTILRNNLTNYRAALVEFHTLMQKLETMVLDEEFRATAVEGNVGKSLKSHDATLERLSKKIGTLDHLQKRSTQLHRYINEVKKDLQQAVVTWQVGASNGEGTLAVEPSAAILTKSETGASTEPLASKPLPRLVPTLEKVIKPLAGSEATPPVDSRANSAKSANSAKTAKRAKANP